MSACVWVDGDACPVKEEVIAVARRFETAIHFVSSQPIKALQGRDGVQLTLCEMGADAADDVIVEGLKARDVVVTSDLLLAKRCLTKGAAVINMHGRRLGKNEVSDGLERKTVTLLSQALQGQTKKGKKKKPSPFKGNLHNLCSKLFVQKSPE